jgi:hypothetical protein
MSVLSSLRKNYFIIQSEVGSISGPREKRMKPGHAMSLGDVTDLTFATQSNAIYGHIPLDERRSDGDRSPSAGN